MIPLVFVEDQTLLSPPNFHGSFVPADVKPSEKICVVIDMCFPARVRQISPYGVEIVLPKSAFAFIPDVFDVKLTMGHQIIHSVGTLFCVNGYEGSNVRAAIRLKTRYYEFIAHYRLNCHTAFYPMGIAQNPARHNDNIFFVVRNISRSGMSITTSMQNTYIVPGLVLGCKVYFPSVGETNVTLRVVCSWVVKDGGSNKIQAVDTKYTTMSCTALASISKYALQFCRDGDAVPSFTKLKEEGFYTDAVSSAVDYSYVSTAQDYQDVLQLRLLAYRRENKTRIGAREVDMGDVYDSRSCILIGRYRKKIVCSLRLIFPGQENTMEHEEFITIPDHFPPKAHLIEASRACTHPDYRGGDLYSGLMTHATMVTAQYNGRYVVISATDKLKHLYERVGFVSQNVRFVNETLNSTSHTLLICDVQRLFTGASINFVTWNYLVKDILCYVPAVEKNVIDCMRISMYRLLGPLACAYVGALRKPRRQPRWTRALDCILRWLAYPLSEYNRIRCT